MILEIVKSLFSYFWSLPRSQISNRGQISPSDAFSQVITKLSPSSVHVHPSTSSLEYDSTSRIGGPTPHLTDILRGWNATLTEDFSAL